MTPACVDGLKWVALEKRIQRHEFYILTIPLTVMSWMVVATHAVGIMRLFPAVKRYQSPFSSCRSRPLICLGSERASKALWWSALVPLHRQAVNPARPGREQRSQPSRVPGCGWCWTATFIKLLYFFLNVSAFPRIISHHDQPDI